jgi:hypothetical protein
MDALPRFGSWAGVALTYLNEKTRFVEPTKAQADRASCGTRLAYSGSVGRRRDDLGDHSYPADCVVALAPLMLELIERATTFLEPQHYRSDTTTAAGV